MDKKGDGVDDIIILTGLGQRTEWRMPPNTTRCPFNKCGEAFEDRSALKTHYQEQHAPHMVLCEICDKPLTANHISTVLRHYREKHPNAGRPLSLLRNARKSIQGRPTEHVSWIVKKLDGFFLNSLAISCSSKILFIEFDVGLRWS